MAALTLTRIQGLRFDRNGRAKQILWDGRLAGFGVRVYPTGRKSYVLRYGSKGRERLMVLAPVTDGRDVDEVRAHAQTLLRQFATKGADPLAEKRKAETGTVKDVVLGYIAARTSQWRAGEAKRAKGRMNNHLGSITAVPLDRLTRREVREMHAEISKSAPYEANRTLQLLRAAINWALAEGGWRAADLAEGENPAARVKLNKERARREWVQPDELPALLKAIDAEENPWMRAFFRMVLYTGARKSELLALQWGDVDLKRKTVTFRDTKNREDHTVPLAAEAVQLLQKTPVTLGNPFVFCGHVKGRAIQNPYKPWSRVLERAGIDRRITLHDVRRTVGSLLASQGYSTQQIGKLLNHKSNITAKVYAEIADSVKADMTTAMAKLLG